jgi:hypothetical protein
MSIPVPPPYPTPTPIPISPPLHICRKNNSMLAKAVRHDPGSPVEIQDLHGLILAILSLLLCIPLGQITTSGAII